MPRRQYTEEFKQNAVQLVKTSGKTASEIAKDLGVNSNILSRWVREQNNLGERSFPGKGKRTLGTEAEEELLRLKKELALVKEERDILKKAMAIFTQPPQ